MIFKLKYASVVFFLCAMAAFVFYTPAYAQFDQISTSKDILLSLSPAYPGPHEEVRIIAETFSFDVQTTALSWYVNGELVKSGKGIISVTITTGSLGTPTVVRVTANPPGVTRYDKKLTIWPSDLDVAWHTNTYTPPGYRGKALPVRGSTVTFVALPYFTAENGYEDSKGLLYEWRVDNALQKAQSGRGKNVFSTQITKSKNVPPEVLVHVTNERKTIIQEKRVLISVREPELLFYELHPLQGPLYQHVIGDMFRMKSGGETQILAEPYYTTSKPANLTFQWKVDSTLLVSNKNRPEVLSYSAEAGNTAQQTIALEIRNPFYILEQIQKSFLVYVE